MPYLNKILLIGHAGRDAELKFTPGGIAVCKFSLAVSEKVKGEAHTEWFDITCFNKTAEFASDDVKKGGTVFVEGRIRTEKWVDKSGQNREKRGVIADSVKVFKKAQEKRDDATTEELIESGEMPF